MVCVALGRNVLDPDKPAISSRNRSSQRVKGSMCDSTDGINAALYPCRPYPSSF